MGVKNLLTKRKCKLWVSHFWRGSEPAQDAIQNGPQTRAQAAIAYLRTKETPLHCAHHLQNGVPQCPAHTGKQIRPKHCCCLFHTASHWKRRSVSQCLKGLSWDTESEALTPGPDTDLCHLNPVTSSLCLSCFQKGEAIIPCLAGLFWGLIS